MAAADITVKVRMVGVRTFCWQMRLMRWAITWIRLPFVPAACMVLALYLQRRLVRRVQVVR